MNTNINVQLQQNNPSFNKQDINKLGIINFSGSSASQHQVKLPVKLKKKKSSKQRNSGSQNTQECVKKQLPIVQSGSYDAKVVTLSSRRESTLGDIDFEINSSPDLTEQEILDIDFPFQPYEPQIDYMTQLLSCLKQQHYVALEASTGFGKTVCIISVCRAFVDKCKQIVNQIKQLEYSLSQTDIYFVRTTKLFRELQVFGTDGSHRLNTDNIQITVSGIKPPSIVYASRTHSQLRQVSSVLKQLKAAHVTLGSRQQYCASGTCRDFSAETGLGLNQCCRRFMQNGQCILHQQINVQAAVEDLRVQQRALDVEDLIAFAAAECVCPFWLSRAALSSFSFVLTPYQYLMQVAEDENLLRGNIIVLDEAHNVPRVFCDEFSTKILYSDLEDAVIVTKYLSAAVQEEKKKTIDKTSLIEKDVCDIGMINKITEMIETLIDGIKTIATVNQEKLKQKSSFDIDNHVQISMQKLFNGVETNKILPELLEAMNKMDFYINQSQKREHFRVQSKLQQINQVFSLFQRTSELSKDLKEIGVILSLEDDVKLDQMKNVVKDHKTTPALLKKLIEQNKSRENLFDSLSIQIECFSPQVSGNFICNNNPLAIIATSGTLSPLIHINEEFGIQFNVSQSFPHVCKKENVKVSAIQKHKGNDIIGSFKQRSSDNYIDAITVAVNSIPHRFSTGGALVFFQSYAVLKQFQTKISAKNVFYESQNQKDNERAFENFKQLISKNLQATLICVYGGKFSEGVDFSDQQCRLALCISVPFGAVLDCKLKEKMRFLDRHSQMRGRSWYELQAYRAVNQAAGRAIRHALDFGEICLLDHRFGNNAMLSYWLSQNIQNTSLEQWQEDKWLDQRIRQWIPKDNQLLFLETKESKQNQLIRIIQQNPGQNQFKAIVQKINNVNKLKQQITKTEYLTFDELMKRKENLQIQNNKEIMLQLNDDIQLICEELTNFQSKFPDLIQDLITQIFYQQY